MAFAPKMAPAPSLHLLAHPESDTEYVHFQVEFAEPGTPPQPAVTGLPFEVRPGFSTVNAWWLAEASLLAYWDLDAAGDRFRRQAGLETTLLDRESTQCYVASNGTFAIVAFRGMQPDQVVDVWRSLDFVFTPWDRGGQVHGGFMRALDVVWDDLLDAIGRTGVTSVWFTGHSLGGALATLAADRFGGPSGVYTIGSARVGDADFVAGFNARHDGRSFRYVNHHDVVTHVPPSVSGFRHVNLEKHFDGDGVLRGTAIDGQGMLEAVATRLAKSDAVTGALLLPSALVDHTPRRYATFAWNACTTPAEVSE